MKTHTIVKFTVGALALALVSSLHAQTAAASASEPKAQVKAAQPAPTPTADPHPADLDAIILSLAYEAFSLPIAKAGELQRRGMTDEELYKEVLASGKLERLLVLRTKSNQIAQLQNVALYSYPTEFSPPQIPCGMAENKIQLPVVATAFGEKDVGDLLEAEPTLSPDAKSVDFHLNVSHVALARREKWGQGLAELEQPLFETQKLVTNITASVGSPRLVGTLNPVFGNGLAARAEQNVWFCFITATVSQNKVAAPGKALR